LQLVSDPILITNCCDCAQDFTSDIKQLIHILLAGMSQRANKDLATTSYINACLSIFFKRLLSFGDRGMVFNLIEQAMTAMPTQLRVSHLVSTSCCLPLFSMPMLLRMGCHAEQIYSFPV
jgi:hypothetical protein